MAAICAQLARSEGRDEGSSAIDARVPVRSVRSYKLVGVAAELDACVADQVEESEFVVCAGISVYVGNTVSRIGVGRRKRRTSWHAPDSLDAELRKALEEVVSNLDLRHPVCSVELRCST